MTVAMLLLIGGDLEALRKSLADFLRTALESGLPQVEGQTKLSEAEVASLADIAFGILPAASSMSWISSLLFNLWVAGRVTLASGQLGRPWPDLSAITYPTGTPLAFGLMLAATMLGGYAGLAASAFAGALFIAYVLLGLAIVHFTTRGRPWRPLALWMLYGSLFIVNIWIGIVIAMVGLAETVLHLRARAAQRTPPPTHPNS